MNIYDKMETFDNNKAEKIDILVGDETSNQIQSDNQSADLVDEKSSELLDSLQRLQADFNNYRKRAEKEKQELAEFVKGNVALEILPILDDFERLLSSKSKNIEIKKGALLIYKNLKSVLEKFGLEAFLDKGEDFDPNFHEALSVKTALPEDDGKILEIWQKGYRLKNRLLRPAKVVVGEFKTENKISES